MINLATPIENFARVGPKFLARLKKLGIKTARDLLWHFPTRYEDYSKLILISDVADAGQSISIMGRVATIDVARSWKRRMAIVNAVIEDKSGTIRAVWFNQPYIADTLREGTLVSLAGKTSTDKNGPYLSSPSYEKIGSQETNLTHTGRLVPVYPETEGLTSKYLRFLIKPLLTEIKSLPDPLPSELRQKHNLPELTTALQSIHFPENIEQTEHAKQRFSFEEILLFQLRALRDHRQMQAHKAPTISFDKKLIADFVKTLPFELTNDQRIAAYEILQDLERPFPMNRLLNGDVGSGKTVVALIAAYQTTAAGYQVVFLAPTEILAKQHFDSLRSLSAGTSTNISSLSAGTSTNISSLSASTSTPSTDSGQANSVQAHSTNIGLPKANTMKKLRIGLLTGSEARQWPIDEITEEDISKKLMKEKIAKGKIDLVIGTHAIIQKDVIFKNLGLVVIDEQHRFGINQRMKLLKNQEMVPHLLSMTATPIPRTLALTIYGDLDVSLIREKPKGRQTIITKAVPHSRREEAHGFIDKQLQKGRQVFVICPRIAAPEYGGEPRPVGAGSILPQKRPSHHKPNSATALAWAEVKAVTEEYEKLSKKIFPHRRVAMLHGKLKSKDKNELMKKFKEGHYDILVSTSVVEVGVDVPNATIMMIESAERFGLAQLHQFRGRVGRGQYQSYCFLFTSSDDVPTGRRLRALEQTDDGFKLAEADLKIRGPGEFTGIKQSGFPDIAMASLTDIELIKKARLEAKLLLKDDPALKHYPLLSARLNEIERLVHFE